MAENINFIPASELPVAEGDEVSVLCVEGGELKQKPVTGLGGGSYILKPTVDELTPSDNGVICTSDCTDMVKALETGTNVRVLLPAGFISGGEAAVAISAFGWLVSDGLLCGSFMMDNMLFPNAPIPSFLQE